MSGIQRALAAVSLLAVLAGFVICYGRLRTIFEARTWQVGLMRAVGLQRWIVFVELLKESLLIGLAGLLGGIPLGTFIARYGLEVVATATALNYRMPVPVAHTTLTPSAAVLGAAVGLGAALLAAAVPAFRLARTQPVAALSMRGRDTGTMALRGRWVLVVCLLAIVVTLVAAQQASGNATLGNVTTGLVAITASRRRLLRDARRSQLGLHRDRRAAEPEQARAVLIGRLRSSAVEPWTTAIVHCERFRRARPSR